MNNELKEKTCCLTGHRKLEWYEKLYVKFKLKKVLVNLIEEGVVYFGVGGAIGFDMIAEKEILRLRKIYPFIKLILVLPCKEHYSRWKIEDVNKYLKIESKADKIVYISEKYYKGCMIERDKYLVNNSSYCLCYIRKSKSGSEHTAKYAINKHKQLIYL